MRGATSGLQPSCEKHDMRNMPCLSVTWLVRGPDSFDKSMVMCTCAYDALEVNQLQL